MDLHLVCWQLGHSRVRGQLGDRRVIGAAHGFGRGVEIVDRACGVGIRSAGGAAAAALGNLESVGKEDRVRGADKLVLRVAFVSYCLDLNRRKGAHIVRLTIASKVRSLWDVVRPSFGGHVDVDGDLRYELSAALNSRHETDGS